MHVVDDIWLYFQHRGETQESKSDDDDDESDLPSFREFLYGSDSSGKDVIMFDLDSPDSKVLLFTCKTTTVCGLFEILHVQV